MQYILGVDLGTSSIKLLLINKKGKIVDSQQYEYELIVNKKNFSEQDVNNWTKGFDICLENLIKKNKDILSNLEAISFSGQMHSLVLLDKNNEPLRNAILWNDTRTSKECEFLNNNYKSELLNYSNNIALDGFTLPKLLWVKNNEPEIFSSIKTLLLPKDYLCFYLTGIKQMELTDSSGTLMLDMNTNKWNESFLSKLGIDSKILPTLNQPITKVGILKLKLKEKFGFKRDINIYSGAADNVCGAIGSGMIDKNKTLISIGTSGVFLKITEKNLFNGKLHYFNYVENLNYSMGVTLSAGISLNWLKNNILINSSSYDEILNNINSIKLEEENLLFTPWLFGERTPYLDSNIRGSFIGLDYTHTNNHLVKAVIEGITFSLNTCKEIYQENTKEKLTDIICTGGGSKNKIWLQIQADIFNANIHTLDNSQGPAFGAGIIAAVGEKWFSNFKDCTDLWIKIAKTYTPIKENVEIYKKLFLRYSKIYEQIKNI